MTRAAPKRRGAPAGMMGVQAGMMNGQEGGSHERHHPQHTHPA
jgi:hypothetical protein